MPSNTDLNNGKAARLTADDTDALQQLMSKTDVMVEGILPFVGVGYFAFVAGVDKNFRECYKQFVSTIQDPPRVDLGTNTDEDGDEDNGEEEKSTRPVCFSDTFYSAACASVSCAEYWYSSNNGNDQSLSGICSIAAGVGSLCVLQWARDRQLPWDAKTCAAAAENGHLEVLQWAHENGCPWNKYTCMLAAEAGNLEVLQWAHGNGCPWDWETCYSIMFLNSGVDASAFVR